MPNERISMSKLKQLIGLQATRRPSRSRGESRNRECGPLGTTRSLCRGQ
jgi:hypothetical protein